ncbi:MAG: hypothetical protein RR696_14370 [Clostridia bacterium]
MRRNTRRRKSGKHYLRGSIWFWLLPLLLMVPIGFGFAFGFQLLLSKLLTLVQLTVKLVVMT